jgi:RimJ/RimL family protein N-acetyltransferase
MAEGRLETERLVLRTWLEEDWPLFFARTNTPTVMRWLGGVMDEDKQAAQRQRIHDCFAEHGHGFWAVERKADGALLGFCGLKRANQPGGPQGDHEIGWRLREDAWGQGFAREAALAARDDAFRRLGVPHIIALTVQGNAASWGLMERIGMRRRPDQDFASTDFGSDTIIAYSLDREEWAALAHEQAG